MQPRPILFCNLIVLTSFTHQMAFRVGSSTKLDDRVYAMEQCKNLPLCYLMLMLYPNMYPLHSVDEKVSVLFLSVFCTHNNID